MRAENAAEMLLSLVTSPETAASAIGDLAEEASARGMFWFWWSVLRTVVFKIRRDLWDAPRQTWTLALSAFFLGLCLQLVTVLIFLPVQGLAMAFGGGTRVYASGGALVSVAPPNWIAAMLTILIVTVASFIVGWWIAKRSGGREIAAIVVCMLLLTGLRAFRMRFSVHTTETQTQFWISGLFLAIGGVLSRFSRLGPARIRRILKGRHRATF